MIVTGVGDVGLTNQCLNEEGLQGSCINGKIRKHGLALVFTREDEHQWGPLLQCHWQ
jgi:hypothetical protein